MTNNWSNGLGRTKEEKDENRKLHTNTKQMNDIIMENTEDRDYLKTRINNRFVSTVKKENNTGKIGWQTMMFWWDDEKNKVVDWEYMHVGWSNTFKEAKETHMDFVMSVTDKDYTYDVSGIIPYPRIIARKPHPNDDRTIYEVYSHQYKHNWDASFDDEDDAKRYVKERL